jgi:hypothetical protein
MFFQLTGEEAGWEEEGSANHRHLIGRAGEEEDWEEEEEGGE